MNNNQSISNPFISKKTAITLIILFCTIFFAASWASAKMVCANRNTVNLRSGPGTKYAIKWEYGRGFPMRVIGRKGDWYKVKDFENDVGWVYRNVVASKSHMIVKRKVVNVRNKPSSKAKLIGKADYGVVFKTIKQKKGWAKVKHENGLTGWVRRDLLWGW